MIVQCDQCNTRFKLDDAKVREEGVKVRCSKCKNIFVVKKVTPQEENEFESILGQLGSDTSEKNEMGEMETPYQTFGNHTAPLTDGSDATLEEEQTAAESSATESTESWPEENFNTFPAVDSESAISSEQGFDFERFNFEDEPSSVPQTSPSEGVAEGKDDDVFTFGNASSVGGEEFDIRVEGGEKASPSFAFDPLAVTEENLSEGNKPEEDISFTFEKELQERVSPESEEEPALSWHDDDSLPVERAVVPDKESGGGSDDTFNFSSIDFGTVPPDEKGPTILKQEKESSADGDSEHDSRNTDEFFAFSPSADESAREDELPPLSIASRRKGLTSAPIIVIVIAVVIVLALAAAGLYLFAEGPAGFEKAGLGFVVNWLGIETKEDGGIFVHNTTGSFVVNKESRELFVIRGEAVNNFRKPRASIQVKVVLYGPKGQVTAQKSAYCGNMLSNEQVVTLPMEKIEESMNNQFGDSLSNLGVQPGKGIPFVVVLSSVPKDVTEFGVEVIGSTVASR